MNGQILKRLFRDDCVEWFELLNTDLLGTGFVIEPCPYFYRGKFDQKAITAAWEAFKVEELSKGQEHEGYVIHDSGSFHYKDYRRAVLKFVRAGHVQPHGHHWQRNWQPNQLKN